MYVLPSYVFRILPYDIFRYIGTFMVHPDTEIRILRAFYIVTNLVNSISKLVDEVSVLSVLHKDVLDNVYTQDKGLVSLKTLCYIKEKLDAQLANVFDAKLSTSIDSVMFLYRNFNSGTWFCRDIAPFVFPLKLQNRME